MLRGGFQLRPRRAYITGEKEIKQVIVTAYCETTGN